MLHASHELQDAIPGLEASETQSGDFFIPPTVIVRLYARLLDPALPTFELCVCCT